MSCKPVPSLGSQGAVYLARLGRLYAVDGVIEKTTEQRGGMKLEGAVTHPTAPNGLCASPVIDAGASG